MVHTSLASQIHFRKRGKHLANCVYKPCPVALNSAFQSRCSILSHDTLCHCLSSSSSLENSERDLGHLSCYCRSCKNTLRIGFRECAYSATSNSLLEVWLVIQLISFQWDTACIHSSPDLASYPGHAAWVRGYTRPFPLLRKWVWIVRQGTHFHLPIQSWLHFVVIQQSSFTQSLVTRSSS